MTGLLFDSFVSFIAWTLLPKNIVRPRLQTIRATTFFSLSVEH